MAGPAVRVGCSGWSYQHWRERFYAGAPPARWLERYAQEFDTVELNTTFYRLTKPAVVADWIRRTPPAFVFAAKASRYLIHMKRLTDLDQGVDRFYDSIAPLIASPKLGPIVWQLPENFHRDDERLAGALQALRRRPGRHCWEFRHQSWFADEVYDLLRRHEHALVIGDHPKRPFQTHELTTDWTLIRFHYGSRGRNGNYSDREIAEWAERIRSWPADVRVWVYFNNDWNEYAINNAVALRARLNAG